MCHTIVQKLYSSLMKLMFLEIHVGLQYKINPVQIVTRINKAEALSRFLSIYSLCLVYLALFSRPFPPAKGTIHLYTTSFISTAFHASSSMYRDMGKYC
jgi:hypothetical protein